MKLTKADYKKMAAEVNTDGYTDVEFKKGNETLFLDVEIEISGYVEEATNAFVETNRLILIDDVVSYDDDGNKTTNDFDEDMLRKEIA